MVNQQGQTYPTLQLSGSRKMNMHAQIKNNYE